MMTDGNSSEEGDHELSIRREMDSSSESDSNLMLMEPGTEKSIKGKPIVLSTH